MPQPTSRPGDGRIVIRGARTHNLQNLALTLPKRQIVAVTGVSGSGKSSLAFDTVYAEGQRRYVESLSAYARQFLERMEKPDVDRIDGICPAIAIRQKNSVRNPRSTVGTTTEVHDCLRLLFARVGRTICHGCGEEVVRDTAEVAARRLTARPAGTRLLIGFDVPIAGGAAADAGAGTTASEAAGGAGKAASEAVARAGETASEAVARADEAPLGAPAPPASARTARGWDRTPSGRSPGSSAACARWASGRRAPRQSAPRRPPAPRAA